MSSDWPVEVRFGGLGGQGLVTLGAVLAEAGARAGLRVAASQSYGSRARGGATRADVILSTEAIDFPHVHHPDLLVVLAQEAYELYGPDLRDGGLTLADEFFVKIRPRDGVKQLGVAGTATALAEVGSEVAANFVMLGALLGYTGLVGRAEVEQAMGSLVKERFVESNRRALGCGWELGQDLGSSEAGLWR